MEGQYLGPVLGDTPGAIAVDIDRVGNSLTGSATFVPADRQLPRTCARFPLFENAGKVTFSCPIVPVNFDGTEIAPERLQEVFPDTEHATSADIDIEFLADRLEFKYATDIGFGGSGSLIKSRADSPSQLEPDANVQTWASFKSLINNSELDGWIFRGQASPSRLRTSFHRTNRKDLVRYVDEDLRELARHFADQEGASFESPEDFGSFLNWLQHHGYPTPLLDWSSSPWVAAFFAFRNPVAPVDAKVRLFLFNFRRWEQDMPQFPFVSRVPIHLSHLQLGAARNRRVGPQKAKTLLTNVDDIEEYIQWHEEVREKVYLLVVDLPHTERPKVLSDLQLMNVTPDVLFPDSSDAICETFRNKKFFTR